MIIFIIKYAKTILAKSNFKDHTNGEITDN